MILYLYEVNKFSKLMEGDHLGIPGVVDFFACLFFTFYYKNYLYPLRDYNNDQINQLF
jgi:hypothetical protein